MTGQFNKPGGGLRFDRKYPPGYYEEREPSISMEYILDNALLIDGSRSMLADLKIRNQKGLLLYQSSSMGANYIGLLAPTTLVSSISFYLPATLGVEDDILMVGPSGDMFWSGELRDARGEMDSLDERLDIAIDEHGHLKGTFMVDVLEDGVEKVSDPTDLNFVNRFSVIENPSKVAQIDINESEIDHGSIGGLADDDHTQYLLADGTRSLSGNMVVDAGITIDGVDVGAIKLNSMPSAANGDIDVNTQKVINVVDPGADQDAATKKYVDDLVFASGVTDHGNLTGLEDDDHTQYSLVDGSRTFINPISGQTPIAPAHLTTKGYVDSIGQKIDWQESVLDQDLTTPSGSPDTGDRYIVASGGAGDWLDQDKKITEWSGSSWDFITPDEGFAVWVEDEDILCVYNDIYPSGNWVRFGSTIDHNNLSSLQGGQADEYYHLNSAEYTELNNWLPSVSLSTSGGDSLIGLPSGNLILENGEFRVEYNSDSDKHTDIFHGYASGTESYDTFIKSTGDIRIMPKGNACVIVQNPLGGGDITYLQVFGKNATSRGEIRSHYGTGTTHIGMYHDGTDARIRTTNGNLIVRASESQDALIVSGASGRYGEMYITYQEDTSKSVHIYHNGSHGYIENYTGCLRIRNIGIDDVIQFLGHDDSHYAELKLYREVLGSYSWMYYDGTNAYFSTAKIGVFPAPDIYIKPAGGDVIVQARTPASDTYLRVIGAGASDIGYIRAIYGSSPTGSDYIQMHHDGTDGYIGTNAGDLKLNSVGDININPHTVVELKASTGSPTLLKIKGKGDASSYGQLDLESTDIAVKMSLYHDTTDGIIKLNAGNIYIKPASGVVYLQNNEAEGDADLSLIVRGNAAAQKGIVNAQYGTAGGKVSMYHDGTDGYIESNTGVLNLKGIGGITMQHYTPNGTLRLCIQGSGDMDYGYLDLMYGTSGMNYLRMYHDGSDGIIETGSGGIKMSSLKSGTSQANAGATEDELWVDTDDDNTVKRGVAV